MKITIKQITCVVLAATTFALVGCTTPTRYSRSTGQYIDDKTVAGKVKSALNRDSLTDGTQIKVDSFRGNVHITGFVDHPVQKERASEVASRVEGVQYFKNDIIVKNQLPTMRTMQGSTMREPAGAEINTQRQQFRSNSSFQDQGGAEWQRGSYNSFGPRNEFSEPAGAESGTGVEFKQKRNGTKVETQIDQN